MGFVMFLSVVLIIVWFAVGAVLLARSFWIHRAQQQSAQPQTQGQPQGVPMQTASTLTLPEPVRRALQAANAKVAATVARLLPTGR
ncbi:MAG: hypothetical protein OJF49_000704 [Ktedonobacterales bacterium]|nr:MAG: hypothetical protein OJF49_000704 [Ktedonobacterales bacterium]